MAKSLSGVQVDDEIITKFNEMKIGHKYRYMQMKLTDDHKVITIEKCVDNAEYQDFLDQLPAEQCRYVLYDYKYKGKETGDQEKLVFIVW